MASSSKLAPWLYDMVRPYIEVSAVAAGQQCDGGDDGHTCGLKWTDNTTWDGSYGVGQQMAALEIVQALLIQEADEQVTADTGGTSQGDPNAGTGTCCLSPKCGSFRRIVAYDNKTQEVTRTHLHPQAS